MPSDGVPEPASNEQQEHHHMNQENQPKTGPDQLVERVHALEVAQATQAATLAGAQATQAAVQAGTVATNAAAQAGTVATMVAGGVCLIVGIFLGIALSRAQQG